MRKTVKPWLDIPDLLQLLKDKGMDIPDEKQAVHYLRTVGYYRLSGYFYSFKSKNNTPVEVGDSISDSRFAHSASFNQLIELYEFDKKLRLLVLEALVDIEIYVRAKICHILGKVSPLSYKDSSLFNSYQYYQAWMERQQEDIDKNKKNPLINHHLQNYSDIPIWAAAEVWSFGTLVRLYSYILMSYQGAIAKSLHIGVQEGKQILSHLKAFNFVRNTAAHHSILWNVALRDRPSLKGFSDTEWRLLNTNKVFSVLCLLNKYLQVIHSRHGFGQKVLNLIDIFPVSTVPKVSLLEMGFDKSLTRLLK